MKLSVRLGPEVRPVTRLGLATRGNTSLTEADIKYALDKGINYLNWSGHQDGISRAVQEMTNQQRDEIVLACQFSARTAREADRELTQLLRELGTQYIDVLTFYYVEAECEWERIIGKDGAYEFLLKAKKQGLLRFIGLTTHQRSLAARCVQSKVLDLIMVRYNAAHRGAEQEVFPHCRYYRTPVVAFTCLRWGGLLRTMPGDSPQQEIPPAPEWYRFVVSHPDVAIALMAPNGRKELQENLQLLDDWRPVEPAIMSQMRNRGDRVRKHGGRFP